MESPVDATTTDRPRPEAAADGVARAPALSVQEARPAEDRARGLTR